VFKFFATGTDGNTSEKIEEPRFFSLYPQLPKILA